MRRVRVYSYNFTSEGVEKVFEYEANFHQFGCKYDEFETGTGNYSTAIIELDTGEVKNVDVEKVEFIK